MAQFVLKMAHLAILVEPTPLLEKLSSCGLLPRLSLLVSSFSFASTDKDELLSNYQLNYSGQRAEILTQRSNANLMSQRAKNTLINVVTYTLFSPYTRIFPWDITSAERTEKEGRISSHLHFANKGRTIRKLTGGGGGGRSTQKNVRVRQS